jgi:hypothetical protein
MRVLNLLEQPREPSLPGCGAVKGGPSSRAAAVPPERRRRRRPTPGFLLWTACGRLRVPAGGGLVASIPVNRVLALSAAMLVCVGVLMAQDAPRTLGLLVVLMLLLESMVWAMAALVALKPLRRRTRRRPQRPIRTARAESTDARTLNWWIYEAALLLLIVTWLMTR